MLFKEKPAEPDLLIWGQYELKGEVSDRRTRRHLLERGAHPAEEHLQPELCLDRLDDWTPHHVPHRAGSVSGRRGFGGVNMWTTVLSKL